MSLLTVEMYQVASCPEWISEINELTAFLTFLLTFPETVYDSPLLEEDQWTKKDN